MTAAYNFSNGTNTYWANITNMTMIPNSTGLDNTTMIYLFNGSVDTNTSTNRSIANYLISNMSTIIARNSG